MSVLEPTPSEIRLFLERQMLALLDRSGIVAESHSINDHVLIARLDLQQLVDIKGGADQPLENNLSGGQLAGVIRMRRQLLDQVCRFTKVRMGRNLPLAVEVEQSLLGDSANDPSLHVARVCGNGVRLLADKKYFAHQLMRKFPDHRAMFDDVGTKRPRSLDNEEDLLSITLNLDAPAYEMLRTVEKLDLQPVLALPAVGSLDRD